MITNTNNFADLNGLARFGEMTRSSQTEEEYKKRAIQLCHKAQVELKAKEPEPRLVVAWLLKYRNKISKNTFRQYKSALIYYFWNEIDSEASRQAACFLARQNSDFSSKSGGQTSSKKKKNIPQDELSLLISFLRKGYKNKWGNATADWLLASIITGLRPCEWEFAKVAYQDGKDVLIVQNAKSTNGRSNGQFRTLILNQLDEDDLNVLVRHLNNVKNIPDGKFHDFWVSCSKSLNRANAAIFGKRKKNITLYSARHQFSANAKKAKLAPNEVAALMGHATDATATLHYGRKSYGSSGGLKVAPKANEVETVKKKWQANPHNSQVKVHEVSLNKENQQALDFIKPRN